MLLLALLVTRATPVGHFFWVDSGGVVDGIMTHNMQPIEWTLDQHVSSADLLPGMPASLHPHQPRDV